MWHFSRFTYSCVKLIHGIIKLPPKKFLWKTDFEACDSLPASLIYMLSWCVFMCLARCTECLMFNDDLGFPKFYRKRAVKGNADFEIPDIYIYGIFIKYRLTQNHSWMKTSNMLILLTNFYSVFPYVLYKQDRSPCLYALRADYFYQVIDMKCFFCRELDVICDLEL